MIIVMMMMMMTTTMMMMMMMIMLLTVMMMTMMMMRIPNRERFSEPQVARNSVGSLQGSVLRQVVDHCKPAGGHQGHDQRKSLVDHRDQDHCTP